MKIDEERLKIPFARSLDAVDFGLVADHLANELEARVRYEISDVVEVSRVPTRSRDRQRVGLRLDGSLATWDIGAGFRGIIDDEHRVIGMEFQLPFPAEVISEHRRDYGQYLERVRHSVETYFSQ